MRVFCIHVYVYENECMYWKLHVQVSVGDTSHDFGLCMYLLSLLLATLPCLSL